MSIEVQFRYETGLSRSPFVAAKLMGSWNETGEPSAGPWSSMPMATTSCEDGSQGFTASVSFHPNAACQAFAWGVQLQRADGSSAWGVFAEIAHDSMQHRSFVLAPPDAAPQIERYRLSFHRCRGAQRCSTSEAGPHTIRFSTWAPNARSVQVVFAGPSGYIDNDGCGQDPDRPPLQMRRDDGDGAVWEALAEDFDSFIGCRYMFRVERDDDSINWATDMFSREQCGKGDHDPGGLAYDGDPAQLNGRVSCSEVVDLSHAGAYRPHARTERRERDRRDEGHPPLPRYVADLVIYELHVGSLSPRTDAAGTFADAIELLPYLQQLGVNAIELMPMAQFDGTRSWGYGSTHPLAVQSAAGGRDGLMRFVSACHRRGMAVLMDVVYNHFSLLADRAAWHFDSVSESRNIYYWYVGQEQDYQNPNDGYVSNGSSGWAPRYCDEHVRALFVSSAVCLLDEFHIDGLRVDLTAAIHRDNRLSFGDNSVAEANEWGRKFLRELCQTVKTVWPDCLLIAEDHSHWSAVTEPAASGGIGFDATWCADFFHHLVEADGDGWARLLASAGLDQKAPLHMDSFAGVLQASSQRNVVYEESHDEAGGHPFTMRTILTAVNGQPLVDATRHYAEARCRFACAMSMLSAGTPLIFMGEEVGAQKPFRTGDFYANKEDLVTERGGTGAHMFRFYQDVVALRRMCATLRGENIDVVHTNNELRVIAFRRWDDDREFLVIGSLNNEVFDQPNYRIEHPIFDGGTWTERLSSDALAYGGAGVGNTAPLLAADGALEVVLPANGIVVLERVSSKLGS